MVYLIGICLLVASTSGQLPDLKIEATPNNGLRFELPDAPGTSLVALHYSINQKVAGTSPAKTNVDLKFKTGNNWVYIDDSVKVSPGDILYYWYLAVINNEGLQKLNQQWTVPAIQSTTSESESSTWASIRTMTPPAGDGTPATLVPATPNTPTPVPPEPTGNCTCSGGKIKPICKKYPCLVFEDNFDVLDLEKWEHEITLGGGGNWEFEYYLNNRTNSYVKDGKLFIKPTLTSERFGDAFIRTKTLDVWGMSPPELCTGNAFFGCLRTGEGPNIINPIQSARLRTAQSFTFKYGKVEVEAKMPTGDWLWPAIWMLPIKGAYGLWPASGEIDIVESRGNTNFKDKTGKSIGNDWMGSTLHWGPYFELNSFDRTHAEMNAKSGTFSSDFHKYGVEWDEAHISFFVDGEEILKVDPGDSFWKYGDFDTRAPGTDNPWKNGNKIAPFDQEFFLVMNVAVGGTGFFPDDASNTPAGKPWSNKSPHASLDFWNGKAQWYPTWNPTKNNGEDAAMKVNYVRVWEMKP